MNTGKHDFDKAAATWDEKPERVKLAADVSKAIRKQINLASGMNIMDFGCGTGLLTVQLCNSVKSITAVDSSQGMLDILNKKIADLKISNVKVILSDSVNKDILPDTNYDLVYSSMAMHHIKDIRPLFRQFHEIIAPGGHLCIADLDSDNGRFHADNAGVFHQGFSRGKLSGIFTGSGFGNITITDAAEVIKPDVSGQVTRFTVFLIAGQIE